MTLLVIVLALVVFFLLICLISYLAPGSYPLSEVVKADVPEYITSEPRRETNSITLDCNTLFQSYYGKPSPKMASRISELLDTNPKYQYCRYSGKQAKVMMQSFHPRVYQGYKTLLCPWYKRTMWKYCSLYIYGGVYIDADCRMYDPIPEITDSEYLIVGPYDSFIACSPKNQILKDMIINMVENIETRFYGNTPGEVLGSLKQIIISSFGNIPNPLVTQVGKITILETKKNVCYWQKQRLYTYNNYDGCKSWKTRQVYKNSESDSKGERLKTILNAENQECTQIE